MPRTRPVIFRLLSTAFVLAVGTVVVLPSSDQAHASNPPAFVQQVATHQAGKSSVSVTLPAALGNGNRLIVEVGVWSSSNATAASVVDAAGDTFTELLHFTTGDHTEMSVWSAPVTAGAGTSPAITVKPMSSADVGVVAAEYSGISGAATIGSVDSSASASGKTTTATSVSSGATAPASTDNEIAIGFYADSGFNSTLAAGSGWTARANVSPTSDMQLLVEDRAAQAGATPAATIATSANTWWLAATIVFLTGSPTLTAPGAPTNVVATPGDGGASVAWSAPPSGGSTILSYTITPYAGPTALAATTVSGSPPASAATIGGLTNGTSYTFTVTATNSIGTGPASAPSNSITPAPNSSGSWAPVQTWPIVPLAMYLTYNGEIVAWDGWQQPQPAVVWNPSNPASFTTVAAPDSVFCNGGAALPDGRLLIVGGWGGQKTGLIGINDTNIFDPVTNTWSRVADMHSPRWYPTLTELGDGRYVAISGNSTGTAVWADTPEVYDPASNTWTQLTNVSTPEVHEDEYPFSYLVPSGNVFTIGPEEDDSHLLDVTHQTWTSVGSAGFFNGSSVMYRPGKILYSGGADSINTPTPAHANTSVIDLTATSPQWQATAPMNYPRIYHTLTMLADGTVLAVGGADTSDQHVITTGVMPTEIWNPSTQVWTPAAPIAASRNYHSTAVLLPDGRVLVGGGGHPTGLGDAGQFSTQIYSPAYLSAGTRPTITSAPASATYGSTMTVTTPDAAAITGVNLVSLGADTHQIDMNQHFVPLSFTTGNGSLAVTAPASGAYAPPGYYMMFILKNGVPSVASIVHIDPSQNRTVPGAPTNVVASAGNGAATVTWTAPTDGGSPLTSYTVTPYIGSAAQPATTVTGNPLATTATVSGLANGTTYTFTVSATNSVGTGPASAVSNPVTPSSAPAPAYLQQVSGHGVSVTSLALSTPNPVGAGNRLVVEAGVWSRSGATASSVTDSAGNTYTEVTSFKASDNTEMSVWTAPVTAGGGTRPTITVTPSAAADVGLAASEYAGLSTATGAAAVDVVSHAVGKTTSAATVASGATAPASASGELALGFYADSGFSATIGAGSGWTQRSNDSPNGTIQTLTEDESAAAGATPNATMTAGANTVWLAATVVLRSGVAQPPGPPGAPPTVSAVAGNAMATVSWTAPSTNASPITSYTVTPHLGATTLTPVTVVGSPPATTATVGGLTNGQSYTFTVTATNGIGTGPTSTASNSVVPSAAAAPVFVQQAGTQAGAQTALSVTPTANVTTGNRLVVEAATWSSGHATAKTVTDSAGDTFTEVVHFPASDGTELSVWTAVALSTGKATVTVTPSAKADVGLAVLEYSGLGAVDVSAQATGTIGPPARVSPGPTNATTGNGLAVGFYADSGFGSTLSSDAGYQQRVNISPNGNMDLLVEDAAVSAGATPAPSVGTGGNTTWLMATVVFRAS